MKIDHPALMLAISMALMLGLSVAIWALADAAIRNKPCREKAMTEPATIHCDHHQHTLTRTESGLLICRCSPSRGEDE